MLCGRSLVTRPRQCELVHLQGTSQPVSLPPASNCLQASLWRSLFLPIVPPTFVLLQALAIRVMRSTEGSLAMLRAAQYDYKRA